ncbi:MAG TPA: CocE/NonD family hydrolase C-terminal non-catalytic domain-containing protein, partial [Solirubrobacteraceae bacterium]
PAAPTNFGGGFVDTGTFDAPGTSVAFSTAPLAEDTDVVGIPQLRLAKLDAPSFAASQGTDPAGKLVVFAKLYDVAPDGSAVLPRNLVSAARIADVTKPVAIELPGISHRFAKGHRLRLVLATTDVTYRNSVAPGPVTVTVDPAAPSTLTIPRLGAQIGATGSGPSGTTRFEGPEGPVQRPGAGGPPAAPAAAKLPSARSCRSKRRFRIRLRRLRHDRIRSARVTVNGKRVKVVRGKRRLRAPVDLRGLPKGTYRVMVTLRTARGRTLRSVRTYHTCVPGKKKHRRKHHRG